MSTVRRRRQRVIRYVAYLSPVVVLASSLAALAAGGWWPLAGIATAAVVTVALSALVLRLERRGRTALAATRARLATEYAEEQARYSDEHRSFSDHMMSLLDAATVRISILRRRVDSLEREVATVRFLQATGPRPATPSRPAEAQPGVSARPVVAQPPAQRQPTPLPAAARSESDQSAPMPAVVEPAAAEFSLFAEPTQAWDDMWPELAEAPTVVDLIVWEERFRSEDDGFGEAERRSA